MRHILNTLIIWAFQLATWVLQGASWLTGMLGFLFQVIDGRHPINNIRFDFAKTPKSKTPETPKEPDIQSIDLNDPEQVAKFMQDNKDKVRVVNNATGG